MTRGENCTNADDCVNEEDIPFECVPDFSSGTRREVCDCSPLFGWEGEECDEVSKGLIIMRITIIILAIWLIGIIVFLCYTFVTKLTSLSQFKNTKSKASLYKRTCVLILLYLTSSSLLLLSISQRFQSVFDEESFTVANISILGQDLVVVTYENFISVHQLYFLVLIPLSLCDLIIVLTWFGVVEGLANFFPDAMKEREVRFSKFLKVYVPVSCIIMTIPVILFKIEVAIIISVFTGLLVVVFYKKLVNTVLTPLKQMTFMEGSSKVGVYKKSIAVISFMNDMRSVMVCLVAVFGTLFTILLLLDPFRQVKVGGFNHIFFIKDLFLMSITGWITLGVWYSSKLAHNYRHQSAHKRKTTMTATHDTSLTHIYNKTPKLKKRNTGTKWT